MASTNKLQLPGRLGHQDLDFEHDPRSNPKLVKLLKPWGIVANSPAPPVSSDSSHEELREALAEQDAAIEHLYHTIDMSLDKDKDEPEVNRSTTTIKGVDGNDINLYMFRRADKANEALPAVVYTHGGGMVYISTVNPVHDRWATSLAIHGVAVIMVDFRNAYTKDAYNPFPAGLNDCAAAVQYISAHRSELGISCITLQGESGGGNLAIATALKANKEGWVHEIAGVYSSVPSIGFICERPDDEVLTEGLTSQVENNGYFLHRNMVGMFNAYYTPNESDRMDPLAWPYVAEKEDLKGLPPIHLAMDELDPLRDEGIAFYRKLVQAGVTATAQVNLGVVHGTATIFRHAVPEVHEAAVQSIAAFAQGL